MLHILAQHNTKRLAFQDTKNAEEIYLSFGRKTL